MEKDDKPPLCPKCKIGMLMPEFSDVVARNKITEKWICDKCGQVIQGPLPLP